MIETKEFILQDPPSLLSDGEMYTIEDLFSHPVAKKYLHTLLWNQIRGLASIPIPQVVTQEYVVQHAYAKGGIGMLTTLLSIEITAKPQGDDHGRSK